MKYGLLLGATLFSIGILLKECISGSFLYIGLIFIFLCGVFVCLWKKYLHIKGIIICGVGLLITAGVLRAHIEEIDWQRYSSFAVGHTGSYQVIVAGEPEKVFGKSGKIRLLVDLEHGNFENHERYLLRGKAYVYTAEVEKIISLKPGDRLLIFGKLYPLRFYKNPGKINLEKRAQSQRVLGHIYVKNVKDVVYKNTSHRYIVNRWVYQLKCDVKSYFLKYMDTTRSSILMTLLFGGSYQELPDTVVKDFSVTGIIHILSVSGSHIAVVLSFLFLIGKWLHAPKKIIVIVSIVSMCGYALMASLVPSVIRATLMGILSVTGLLCNRDRDALNLLGGAVLLMLILNPLLLYDISFQLSASASLGILLFFRNVSSLLQKQNWIPFWVSEGIALAISAQLVTLPFVLYNFHAFPVYFILSNLLVTPFLEMALLLGLGASLLFLIVSPIAELFLYIADCFIGYGTAINQQIASFPYASLNLRGLTPLEVLGYYVLLLVIFFRKHLWKFKIGTWFTLLSTLLIGIGIIIEKLCMPSLVVSILDVSPAQVFIVQSIEKTILFIKLPGVIHPCLKEEIESYLSFKGIFSIDVLVLESSELKETTDFSLSIPIKSIWIKGINKENLPFCTQYPAIDRNVKRLMIGKNLRIHSVGNSWGIYNHDKGIMIDRGEFVTLKSKLPINHVVWIQDFYGFKPEILDDKIKILHPEVIVFMEKEFIDEEYKNILSEGLKYPVLNSKDGCIILYCYHHWSSG